LLFFLYYHLHVDQWIVVLSVRFEDRYSCSNRASNVSQLFRTTHGKTRAGNCCIMIEGKDKWKTVIENDSTVFNKYD